MGLMLGFSNMAKLLGGVFTVQGKTASDFAFLVPLAEFLNEAILPVTVCLLIAAGIWVTILSINIAKADNPDKAAESKRRLYGMLITIIIMLVILWLLALTLAYIGEWVAAIKGIFSGGGNGGR